MSRTSKKPKFTDEEIVAAILAGAALTKQAITPDKGYFGGHQVPKKTGMCCAVGAGVLYTNLDCRKLAANDTLRVFADFYNTTVTFAVGVSDGFEADADGFVEMNAAYPHEEKHPDYACGWAVGAAVRCSLEEVADPVRAALGMGNA